MKKYAVHWEDTDDDFAMHIFYCKAANEAEAEKKCESAHPSAAVVDTVEEPNANDDLFVELP